MKKYLVLALVATSLASAVVSMLAFSAFRSGGDSALTYLSCHLPPSLGAQDRHLDFTLNEKSGTVASFAEGAMEISMERAVFGPRTVVWSINPGGFAITREVDRTLLTIAETTYFGGGSEIAVVGNCKIIMPEATVF